MGDDDPFFTYMRNSDFFGNSYTNANNSYTNANESYTNANQSYTNANQFQSYDESNSYDKGEGSGYGYDSNNTGEHENENETGYSENEGTQAESEENVNESEGNGLDYSDNFVFNYTFNTFEEAFDHINEVAYGLGFHLIKYKYHLEKSPPYKIVACERCGPYRSGVKNPDNPLRGSRTKKLECPFAVRVINRSLGVWEVVPKCGLHNHHFGKFLDGHRRRAKLSEEQKEFIKQQRQSHVKPGMVRHGFTLMFPNQPAPVLKQIYNENARLSEKERDGRNAVQHMLDIASEANYLTDFMSDPETKALTHVWFAHPEAVEMFKAWPYVVLIDSTYKTNKYDLILVQCVGVTPVGKSFLIGYALIKKETKEGYVWVLRCLLALLGRDLRPNVIVTDHERGLLAALPDVFPNVTMQVEFNRGVDLGDNDDCGCTLWMTHKLYCACRLHGALARGKKIHPVDIHEFWSTLTYKESSHCRSTPNELLKELFNKVRNSHPSVQRDVIESLFSKLHPQNEVVEEPEPADTCKGRPRKSNTRNKSSVEHARRTNPSTTTSNDGVDGPPLELNYHRINNINGFVYADFVPLPTKDEFLGAFDPVSDGHCGFRVISHARTGNEENYLTMRSLLLEELKNPVYMNVYYGKRNDACRRIKWAKRKRCSKPNWMDALDLFGFATLFNWTICLVAITKLDNGKEMWFGSSTYLPLRAAPSVRAPNGILWILFTGNHFVRLRVSDDAAMPPINARWESLHETNVQHYGNIYDVRLSLWMFYCHSGLMSNPYDDDENDVISV